MGNYELIFLYLLKKARYTLKITSNYVVVNSKILYTWKEDKKGYYNVFKHAPKSFTHRYWYKHRQREKSALYRELKGLEGNFPYNHRHCGVWDYW